MSPAALLDAILQSAEFMLQIAITERDLREFDGARKAAARAHAALDHVQRLAELHRKEVQIHDLAERIVHLRSRIELFEHGLPFFSAS